MQHLVVALDSGRRSNGWVAQVGVADLRCLRLIPSFALSTLFLFP